MICLYTPKDGHCYTPNPSSTPSEYFRYHFMTCGSQQYFEHILNFFFPNLQLYSSALVECEDHDPSNDDRSFDVESVKKEIHRGRRLVSTNDFITQTKRTDIKGDVSKRKST